MISTHWALLSAFLVIATMALAYFANPIVPVLLIAILAPPVTAVLMHRSPLDQES